MKLYAIKYVKNLHYWEGIAMIFKVKVFSSYEKAKDFAYSHLIDLDQIEELELDSTEEEN